jgi:uncharacterized membrane protein
MGMADLFGDLYGTLYRYLHVLSGIVWIGMLYFFNLANLPLLKFDLKKPFDVKMAEKANAHLTAKSLFWFRWGALSTVVFGLLLLHFEALKRGGGSRPAYSDFFFNSGPNGYMIFGGIVLGLIMAFNVWAVIWPNQKVILANNVKIAAGVTDDEKKTLEAANAPRVKTAVMASRINTWLSVPMLAGMVFGAHGGVVNNNDYLVPIGAVVLIWLLMWAYAGTPKKKA